MRIFEKIRQWRSVQKGLAKCKKGKLVDIVEPLLDRLIKGRINPGQIMYKYFGKVFANLGRKSLQHARWGTPPSPPSPPIAAHTCMCA